MRRHLIAACCLISLLAFAAGYVVFFISRAHGHGMTSGDRVAVGGLVALGILAGALVIVLVRAGKT